MNILVSRTPEKCRPGCAITRKRHVELTRFRGYRKFGKMILFPYDDPEVLIDVPN